MVENYFKLSILGKTKVAQAKFKNHNVEFKNTLVFYLI